MMARTNGLGFALMLAVSAASAGDVCPEPAYIMKPNSDLLRLHLAFNDSPSSRRLLTEVHYYDPEDPNLTVGMGHWIGGKLAGLFQRLKQDPAIWLELTTLWAKRMDAAMWHTFKRDSGETEQNAAAMSRGLSKLLCADKASSTCVNKVLLPWTHATRERFNDNSHWFHAGWLVVSVNPKVAEQQVRHWADSVVAEGEKEAARRGAATSGGIASVASAVSSGLGTTMFYPGKDPARMVNKPFSKSVSWPLASVPNSARPAGGTVNEQALLEDWRSLAAWQFYSVTKATKKRLVRSRMAAIWDQFYAGTWGPLPSKPTFADISKPRKHSGCYMARGTQDISNPVLIPPTLNCSTALPKPGPAPCTKFP
jgi:hypothetical protein